MGERQDEAEAVRGKELMCDQCGCTRWKCLTKFDGECCAGCEHPDSATEDALVEVLALSDDALVAFVDFVRFNVPKFTRDPAIIRRVLNAYAGLSAPDREAAQTAAGVEAGDA